MHRIKKNIPYVYYVLSSSIGLQVYRRRETEAEETTYFPSYYYESNRWLKGEILGPGGLIKITKEQAQSYLPNLKL